MIRLARLFLPELSALLVVALIAALAWGLRLNHLRAFYKAGMERVQAEYAVFKVKIVDKTVEALQRDRAHAATVEAEDDRISRETIDDYQKRLARARSDYDRLRAAHRDRAGGRRAADLPAAPNTAQGADGAAEEDELSLDERLIATQQAIQLDELISWNEKMARDGVTSASE